MWVKGLKGSKMRFSERAWSPMGALQGAGQHRQVLWYVRRGATVDLSAPGVLDATRDYVCRFRQAGAQELSRRAQSG